MKTIDLGLTFNLIKKIKKGIKPKCNVVITDSDLPGELALHIRICTTNPKTKERLCFDKVITAIELSYVSEEMQSVIVEGLIDKANLYFRNKIQNNKKVKINEI